MSVYYASENSDLENVEACCDSFARNVVNEISYFHCDSDFTVNPLQSKSYDEIFGIAWSQLQRWFSGGVA